VCKYEPAEVAARLEPEAIAQPPAHDAWESAYVAFETPEQEVQKFIRRLVKLGAEKWSRDEQIVELFCGRGNGLHALQRMGFRNIEGVDLSPRLVGKYEGDAKCYVCDCRHLPFADQSKGLLIVQGGLHHLSKLPEDLEQTFLEMQRVLRKDGLIMLVEPWLTPFLRLVHTVCETRVARRCSAKLDSLGTMIEHERDTYERWLRSPGLILAVARTHFLPIRESFSWGKWSFVGKRL